MRLMTSHISFLDVIERYFDHVQGEKEKREKQISSCRITRPLGTQVYMRLTCGMREKIRGVWGKSGGGVLRRRLASLLRFLVLAR